MDLPEAADPRSVRFDDHDGAGERCRRKFAEASHYLLGHAICREKVRKPDDDESTVRLGWEAEDVRKAKIRGNQDRRSLLRFNEDQLVGLPTEAEIPDIVSVVPRSP